MQRLLGGVDRPELGQRHFKGIEHQRGLAVMAHRPADDAPRESVRHDGQMQEAGPGRDLGRELINYLVV